MVNRYVDGLIAYARCFVGRPYLYGANGPNAFDCSGYICWILRKPGIVGQNEDYSAQGLYDLLKADGKKYAALDDFELGTILFFGHSLLSISHVAMVVDPYSMIEAGGGNERTVNRDLAEKLQACVRERAISFRKDLVAAILPAYPWN